MVPDSYHPFFEAAASVSGALIGLLFVAISVAPERLAGHDKSAFRIRAGIAFGTLTNSLLITLVALLPGNNLAPTATVLGIGGLISSAWLAFESAKQPNGRPRVGALIRTTAFGAIFVVQLIVAEQLRVNPQEANAVSRLGFLLLAGYAMAIERSWELVGATGTSLLAHLERVTALHRETTAGSQPDDGQLDEADEDR